MVCVPHILAAKNSVLGKDQSRYDKIYRKEKASASPNQKATKQLYLLRLPCEWRLALRPEPTLDSLVSGTRKYMENSPPTPRSKNLLEM